MKKIFLLIIFISSIIIAEERSNFETGPTIMYTGFKNQFSLRWDTNHINNFKNYNGTSIGLTYPYGLSIGMRQGIREKHFIDSNLITTIGYDKYKSDKGYIQTSLDVGIGIKILSISKTQNLYIRIGPYFAIDSFDLISLFNNKFDKYESIFPNIGANFSVEIRKNISEETK